MVEGSPALPDAVVKRPPVVDADLFEEMQEAFAFCDADRDGNVTTSEFGTVRPA